MMNKFKHIPLGCYRRPKGKPVTLFRDADGLYWLLKNKRQAVDTDELPRWRRVYG